MPDLRDRPFKPSTIGSIDEAILRHIDEKFNLFVRTAAGREKVPVIWQTAERTFQIKNNLESRDTAGKLILPLIAVTRDSIEKDPSFRGKVQAHIFEADNEQGGALMVSRRILQKKTTDHQVAKNLRDPRGDKFYPVASGKIIYQETYIPVPVYVKVMYTINLRTEYIQQMNELMSPFLAKTGQIWSFTIVHENHRYETFIEQVIEDNKNSSNLGEEERKFEAKVKLKVLGYLTNEGENRPRPYNGVRETTVDIVLRERVVTEIPKKTPTVGSPAAVEAAPATTTEYQYNPTTGQTEVIQVPIGPQAIPEIDESITTIGMELYDSDFLEEVTIGSTDEDEE